MNHSEIIRGMSKKELGTFFELSVVSNMCDNKLHELCNKAMDYHLRGMFVSSMYVPEVKKELAGSGLITGSACAFPLGGESPKVKRYIIDELVELGVDSVDMVVNYWAALDGRWDIVEEEFAVLRDSGKDIVVKAIIEVCFLKDEHIERLCKMGAAAGLDFMKSSTGQFDGPSLHQVNLMLKTLEGTKTKVKVAGVKFPHAQNAFTFIMAGVNRIGTQNAFACLDGVDLLRELKLLPGMD